MTDPWRWQPHFEVWLLVVAVIGLGLYAVRVIGPKAVRDGAPILTRRQRGWWITAVAVLWVASDWPVHDIAEEHLYVVHMTQHLLLAYAFPALVLLATPPWLARLIVGDGWFAGSVLRRLCHPVAAGLIFNAVIVFTHWPAAVNASVDIGALHYGMHLVLVFSAVLMWVPVCGPLPELRISMPAQMLYLFLMSVVPTVPAAWLTFADGAVYEAYDTPARLWGISVTSDQQLAGILMKLGAGFYLWTLIVILFFRWYAETEREDQATRRVVTDAELLTWDKVKAELETVPPAPPEPTPRQKLSE
ncbi:MAG: cytochrome c oxidase assembly protein, partial [Acidimicrobiales bacterium]